MGIMLNCEISTDNILNAGGTLNTYITKMSHDLSK